MAKKRPLLERLMEKVRVEPSGCWAWTACLDSDGYGRITLDKKMLIAHRASYMVHVGPIPKGLTLDHVCRNRACVNPAHLEPVSNRENVLRGTGKTAENARRTECVNGHPFAGENLSITKLGHRVCRECTRSRARAKYRARVSA